MRKDAFKLVKNWLAGGALAVTLAFPGLNGAAEPPTCPVTVPAELAPIFSKLPYLGRLFRSPVNSVDGLGNGGGVHEPCDEFCERLGIDFEKLPCGPDGCRVVEFRHTLGAPPARPVIVAGGSLPGNVLMMEDVCPECIDLVDFEEACVDDADCESLRAKLLNLSVQAAVLGNLTELQTALVEARLEMSEQLAESKVEHFEALLELAVENAQLKAKLEFQKEREQLQSELAEARRETSALQATLAQNKLLREAELQAQTLKRDYERLAEERVKLEARVAELLRDRPGESGSNSVESVAREPQAKGKLR